eukprot:c13715_g1_i1 orf=164-316(+)
MGICLKLLAHVHRCFKGLEHLRVELGYGALSNCSIRRKEFLIFKPRLESY